MDADTHGGQKSWEPLALLVRHIAVVASTVLGLLVIPFFRELAAQEIGPSNSLLLLE
jgi:hypothetical protein